MSHPKGEFRKNLKHDLLLCEWTPEKLKNTRVELGLSQNDIAELLDVTRGVVYNIENGKSSSPSAVILYGLIIERYWAYMNGYVPAYRKVGKNTFYEGVSQ